MTVASNYTATAAPLFDTSMGLLVLQINQGEAKLPPDTIRLKKAEALTLARELRSVAQRADPANPVCLNRLVQLSIAVKDDDLVLVLKSKPTSPYFGKVYGPNRDWRHVSLTASQAVAIAVMVESLLG